MYLLLILLVSTYIKIVVANCENVTPTLLCAPCRNANNTIIACETLEYSLHCPKNYKLTKIKYEVYNKITLHYEEQMPLSNRIGTCKKSHSSCTNTFCENTWCVCWIGNGNHERETLTCAPKRKCYTPVTLQTRSASTINTDATNVTSTYSNETQKRNALYIGISIGVWLFLSVLCCVILKRKSMAPKRKLRRRYEEADNALAYKHNARLLAHS